MTSRTRRKTGAIARSLPLPSHAVQRRTVCVVMVSLCAAGLSALALTGRREAVVAGAVVVGLIASYNWLTKGWPVAGALNMGLCRAGSVMLGATAGPQAIWPMGASAALAFGLYIAAVTNLARHETRPRAPLLARVLPMLTALLAALGGTLFALNSPDQAPATGFYLLAVGTVGYLFVTLLRRPSPLPPLIGAHIRALLLFQAATCYAADPWGIGPVSAVALVACWPVSRWAGRWFYAS